MDITLDEAIVLSKSEFKNREAVRVIIFNNENKIALYGSDYLLIPGGGVENGESLEDCCRRESLEEIGCRLTELSKLGLSREIKSRNNLVQNAHYYKALIDGKVGIPTSIQSNEVNRIIKWMTIDEAIKLLESYKESISDLSYNARFNIYANLHFLNVCKQNMISS